MAREYLTENGIVAFKAEAVPGTYLEPVASDYNCEFTDVSIELDPHMSREAKSLNGSLNMPASVSGMRTYSISGNSVLRFSGDENNAPNVFKLLSACGLTVTEDGTNPVTVEYLGVAPCDALSCDITDLTCGTTPDSYRRKVSGIQGSVKLSCKFGEPYKFEFNLSGADAGVAETIISKTPVGLDTGDKERFLGVVFTLDGVTAYKIESFEIDFNTTVTPVKDASLTASGGVAKYQIKGADPKATIVVTQLPESVSGLYGMLKGNTPITALTIAGTHFDIVINDANLSGLKRVDSDGLVSQSLEFEVRNFKLTQKD